MKLNNNPVGYKEIIVLEYCGFEDFYSYAEQLKKKLKISYVNKFNDFDSLYWDFMFSDTLMTLKYNTYLGISIHAERGRESSEAENNELCTLYEIIKEN